LRGSLVLNLLAEGFDISFDFRLEAVPRVFQLTLGAQPSGLTGIGLLLNGLLGLVALLVQVSDELIGFHSGIGLYFATLGFERFQYGIHFVDPLFGLIEIEMHAALRGHDRLHGKNTSRRFAGKLGLSLTCVNLH
jgi:hypothetical protein